MRRTIGRLIALAIASAGSVEALEYVPIYNASLMGGQYFFSGTKSNLAGNLSGSVTPVMKFNDRWSLLPTYNFAYNGTKSVTDPVGSGTLFQQVMGHRASLTGLYTPAGSNWKFKPSVSYKKEFLKETRDEDWGKGLFDYQKIGMGFEAENTYKDPFSWRVGLDSYYVQFPNFQSLESKSGVDPSGNPLGRETAGTKVLDTWNHQLALSASRPFPYNEPKVVVQASYSFLVQMFDDQPVINKQGQPGSDDRSDMIHSLGMSVAYPKQLGAYRVHSRMGLGFSMDGSNQNTFDATRAQYVDNSYSYTNFSAGPSVAVGWGPEKRTSWVNASFSYNKTQYAGRLAQDGAGTYLGEKQWSDRYLMTLGYSHPMAPNLSLKMQTNFLWATSNMAYERSYRYTYRTANYLMGFVYDY